MFLFLRKRKLKLRKSPSLHPLDWLTSKWLTYHVWRGCGATGTLTCCAGKDQTAQPICKTQFLTNATRTPTLRSSTSAPGLHAAEMRTCVHQGAGTSSRRHRPYKPHAGSYPNAHRPKQRSIECLFIQWIMKYGNEDNQYATTHDTGINPADVNFEWRSWPGVEVCSL